MNLKDILAISGLPGLFKMMDSRGNGLLVQDIDGGKTMFYSMRKHQFTPMETVAIYTMSDTIELSEILQRMLDQVAENPPAGVKESKEKIEDYFSSIVPDYDEDRVYVSDMKKVIKWFNILNERGYLTMEPDEEEE
ncbi:MAG: hypothetical protein ACJA1A_002974 [Saprospiraceae bacterium]|jgi:hypothetical protein|tara:strand:+ start:545 stop:952 length:408 start_codon:yes stop_codon:yes gene_type:complete